MPTVALRPILHNLGTASVREMVHSTGSPEQSVYRQAQITAIDQFYRRNQGLRGPFGFPLDDVEFSGGTATRNYAGGQIHFLDLSPHGGEKYTGVGVRFVGFHCNTESDWDGLSPADEPYFIIGVAAANGSKAVLVGPYENIDEGDEEHVSFDIVSSADALTPPIVLGVIGMEHDYGTPQTAQERVSTAMRETERKFDEAARAFSGASTHSYVMPEWSRDILFGWAGEGIAALFGMGDDKIGENQVVLFDDKADLKEWRQLPVLGNFGDNEYNRVINVKGDGEGNYNLYFKVDLITLTLPAIQP